MYGVALRSEFVRGLGSTIRMRGTYGRKTSQTTTVWLPQETFVSIALAFDEGTIDVMLGYKLANNFGDGGRHRDRFDQIVSGVTKSFAFSRIRCDCKKLIGWTGCPRTQGDPQMRCGRRQIVAVGACLSPMQLKDRRARVEQRHVT
jgi:hypothetical protein